MSIWEAARHSRYHLYSLQPSDCPPHSPPKGADQFSGEGEIEGLCLGDTRNGKKTTCTFHRIVWNPHPLLNSILKMMVVVVQSLSCVWPFCDAMDCSPPDSSVHGIFQARILPFPPLGDLPDPGIKPMSPASPALAGRFLPRSHQGSPKMIVDRSLPFKQKTVQDFSEEFH